MTAGQGGAFASIFEPEVFFLGRTLGAGVVSSPTGRRLRRCTILTEGLRDDALGALHFDEVYGYDDGSEDRLHWAVGRGADGRLTASELSVVGEPRMKLEGPVWRCRFKRLGAEPFAGATLEYDAVFTAVTAEMVIKRVTIRLFGLPVATLVGYHQRVG